MKPIIRSISAEDNVAVARLIRTVMPEFGASGQGFAIHDPEVDDMCSAYSRPGCIYLLCEENGRILGGGGIGPLAGGQKGTCELKKMYFLREGRGRGLGQKLLAQCLASAREMGYTYCYLETFNTMEGAMSLYARNGFRRIEGPLGDTGHFACDIFYGLDLNDQD